MTTSEYILYRNLAGMDQYSVASSGEDIELKDDEEDKLEEWYDDKVDHNEVQDLNQDNEERRVKELFEPRDEAMKAKLKHESINQVSNETDNHTAMKSIGDDTKKEEGIANHTTADTAIVVINDSKYDKK